MNRRTTAILIILVYSLIGTLASFHAHQTAQEQIGLHCKICQVAGQTFEHSSSFALAFQQPEAGFLCEDVTVYSLTAAPLQFSTRSPPNA